MSRVAAAVLLLGTIAAGTVVDPPSGAAAPPPPSDIDARVGALLTVMSLDEKVAQLFYGDPPSTDDPDALLRLSPHGFGGIGLEALTPAQRNALQTAFMTRGPHGIPVSFHAETLRSAGIPDSTIFAAPALLGCSWNTSLAEAVGRTVAIELWARGGDRSFSPVLQVTTDPRWGRFYENFGESEVLVGAMGAAMTRGLSGGSNNNTSNGEGGGVGGPSTYLPSNFSLIAFAKHAVAYGMSNADGFAVSVSPRELQEVYVVVVTLPPYAPPPHWSAVRRDTE
jgi:beta-glucosidase-like glycosyl hydrolase